MQIVFQNLRNIFGGKTSVYIAALRRRDFMVILNFVVDWYVCRKVQQECSCGSCLRSTVRCYALMCVGLIVREICSPFLFFVLSFNTLKPEIHLNNILISSPYLPESTQNWLSSSSSSSSWLYTSFLGLGRFFSFLILYTAGSTPWMGDEPVARPLRTYRTAQTE
jgi:hypothetical protein